MAMKMPNAIRSRLRPPEKSDELRLIVPLTIAVWHEDGHWLSECVELEIGSFGDDPNDASAQAMDAVCSYLNTLEDLGQRARVFEERGIQVIVAPTAAWHPEISGEIASRQDVQLRPFEFPLSYA